MKNHSELDRSVNVDNIFNLQNPNSEIAILNRDKVLTNPSPYLIEVIKKAFIDKTDKKKRFVAVQVRFKKKLKTPVTLENIKKTKQISHLPLVKQSRLSVMPIDFKSWKIICKMGKI